MAVAVTVLGSGSKGNCTVLDTARTRILIDAGFSCRELVKRLRYRGMEPESVDGIVITHEHSDHVSGVFVFAGKYDIPVYMTTPTYSAWRRWMRDRMKEEATPCLEKLERFEAGKSFTIGDLDVLPFTTPHDAVDPVGFTFRNDGLKIGYVTDIGYVTRSVADHLRGCHALLMESNHDVEMLRNGPYPFYVKQRVAGKNGHLSNEALANFLTADYDGSAQYLVLTHLSECNNHPEIARVSAERALQERASLFANQLLLASQNEPMETIRL